jgi:hypothetical protein
MKITFPTSAKQIVKAAGAKRLIFIIPKKTIREHCIAKVDSMSPDFDKDFQSLCDEVFVRTGKNILKLW